MQLSKYLFRATLAVILAGPIAACSYQGSNEPSLLSKGGEHDDDEHDKDENDCTRTQGYWKNHPDAWPVSSLTLGGHSYTQEQLIAILHTPVKGNGLIQLAHQLIAAKLNVAAGAPDSSIEDAIDEADALIDDLVVGQDSLPTSATSALTDELDAFNNGDVGPGGCDKPDEDDCDHDGDCDECDDDDDCDHDDDCEDDDGGSCPGDDDEPCHHDGRTT